MRDQQASFADFYASTRDDCLRAVLASVGSRQLAEDCVAEAFARAFASWRKVARHPAPRAWVVRTALNISVSSWRQTRREVPLSALPVRAARAYPVEDDLDPVIVSALAAMPLRQRQVIALRMFLGLDTRQTAQVLGIAPGTVTAHLTRAIATLREEFDPIGTTDRERNGRETS
jgi:RNA polymerase sigma factor (sigma-70 family)